MAQPWVLRVRNGALWLGLGLAGVWGYQELSAFLRSDAFANLREPSASGMTDAVGIRMENVDLSTYEGKTRIASAKIGRMDVRRDRAQYVLEDIRDGTFRSPRGTVRFAAERGEYSSPQRRFWLNDGARVSSPDFNLKVASATFDQQKGQLRVPGTIEGTLRNGKVRAENLRLSPETGDFETDNVVWTGDPGSMMQEAGIQNPGRKAWTIGGKTVKQEGNIRTFTQGTASDGEIIVKAATIVHDTKTDVVTASGGLEYYSGRANLVAEKAVIYRRERRAVLTGSVRMLVKPRKNENDPPKVEEIPPFQPIVPAEVARNRPAPQANPADKEQDEQLRSAKTLRDFPIRILAGKIEYWYERNKRRAVATDSPQAEQTLAGGRWRRFWGYRADHDLEKELLKVSSRANQRDVRMQTSIGDDLTAVLVEASTRENDDSFSGEGIQGTFMAEDEEEEAGPPPPATPPPGNPPPRLRGRIGP